jgi:hypothetical protein
MEVGQCQFETWLEDGREHHLQHLGPACRVGAVELGLNLDRYNLAGAAPSTWAVCSSSGRESCCRA